MVYMIVLALIFRTLFKFSLYLYGMCKPNLERYKKGTIYRGVMDGIHQMLRPELWKHIMNLKSFRKRLWLKNCYKYRSMNFPKKWLWFLKIFCNVYCILTFDLQQCACAAYILACVLYLLKQFLLKPKTRLSKIWTTKCKSLDNLARSDYTIIDDDDTLLIVYFVHSYCDIYTQERLIGTAFSYLAVFPLHAWVR